MRSRALTTFAALAGTSVLALAGCGGGTASAPAADIAAQPEFSGTLSILTKFAGEPLDPYFENLAAEYRKAHPEVRIELIQESDDSVEGQDQDAGRLELAARHLLLLDRQLGGRTSSAAIAPSTSARSSVPIRNGARRCLRQRSRRSSTTASSTASRSISDAKFMGYNKQIFAKLGLKAPANLRGTADELRCHSQIRHDADLARQQGGLAVDPLCGPAPRLQCAAGDAGTDFDPATAEYTDPGYVAALKQFKPACPSAAPMAPASTARPTPRRSSIRERASRPCTIRRSSSSIRAPRRTRR